MYEEIYLFGLIRVKMIEIILFNRFLLFLCYFVICYNVLDNFFDFSEIV